MKGRPVRWNGAWRSVTWASTRALWKPLTPEEQEQDARTWNEASNEQGSFAWVLWCEVRQLAGDVWSRCAGVEIRQPSDPPKTSEGR